MAKVAALGPPPYFASHSLLPTDSGIWFEHEGRTYFGAHPAVWAQMPVAEFQHDLKQIPISRPVFDQTIVDLDKDHDAKLKFYQAMSSAMRGQHPSLTPTR